MARVTVTPPGGAEKKDARAIKQTISATIDTIQAAKAETQLSLDTVAKMTFDALPTNADKIEALRKAVQTALKNLKDVEAAELDALRAIRYLLRSVD